MNPQWHNARRQPQHTGWGGRLFWSVQGLRQTPGYQTNLHTRPADLPACQPGQTHTCTSTRTHAYEVHCATVAILSAPCRRLPGATVPTAATNARVAASRQATIDECYAESCIHWLSCQGRHQWQTPAGQKAAVDAQGLAWLSFALSAQLHLSS